MIVIKFGGTSVGDAERVANAIDIVAERRHLKPIVVVSALSGVTNDLVAATEAACAGEAQRVNDIIDRIRQRHEDVAMRLVQQKFDFFETFVKRLDKQIEEIHTILRGITLLREVTARAHDKIVSIGEKLSSVLFAYSMMMRALPGEHVESEDVIWTNDHFGGATPRMDLTSDAARKTLLPIVERNHIPVLGGFIGRTVDGATTTLGRNGSDYSAAIVAAAVGAMRCRSGPTSTACSRAIRASCRPHASSITSRTKKRRSWRPSARSCIRARSSRPSKPASRCASSTLRTPPRPER